jgi:hypothetical protein
LGSSPLSTLWSKPGYRSGCNWILPPFPWGLATTLESNQKFGTFTWAKSQHLVISGESNNEPSPHSPEMGGIK